MDNVNYVAVLPRGNGIWLVIVANDSNHAYRYYINENRANELLMMLTEGIEGEFVLNDNEMRTTIHLRYDKKLYFNLSAGDTHTFRRVLGKPQVS